MSKKYSYFQWQVLETLTRIEHSLATLFERMDGMSEELDALTLEVNETSTVMDSAVVLINGLAQQLRDLAQDPAAILALAAELDAKSDALAEAVAANTPAEPPVEPPVEPPAEPPLENPF